jgi:outer membrane immunogenic protein
MNTLCKSFIALAAVVSTTGVAIPALADGGRSPAYVDRSSYPPIWHGLYAGLHLGHGESGPADGFLGGAQVGYNWHTGQIVYGIEADVSFADISFNQSFMGASVSGSIDWMATVRGRLGFLAAPNVLFYGTAGFGYASGTGSANVPGLVNFSVTDSESDLVYGVGLEGKLTNTMSARIEYLAFSDLEIDIIRAGINFKLGN